MISAATVAKLRAARIVVIGDIMIDEYLHGTVDRLSPEGPMPVFRVTRTEHRLGGAASAWERAHALANDVMLIGAGEWVGVADKGGAIAKSLLDRGTGPLRHFVADVSGWTTPIKTRLWVDGRPQLARIDREKQTFGVPTLGMVDLLGRCWSMGYRTLLVSDYQKGTITRELMDAVREQGWVFVVDGKGPWDWYRGAFAITPNRAEAAAAVSRVGATVGAANRLYEPHRSIIDELGIGHAVLTEGEEGLVLVTRINRRDRGKIIQPAPRFHSGVASSNHAVGAGDQVAATLTLAIAAGLPIEEACDIAERAARLAVTNEYAPDLADLIRSVPAPEPEIYRWPDHADGIAALVQDWRSRQWKIAVANGCFDLLHGGHELVLATAAQSGARVIVAVNDDRWMIQRKRKPVYGVRDRAINLLRHPAIDAVVVFGTATPAPLWEVIRPDVLVRGSDHGADGPDAAAVIDNGGRIEIVERTPHSTTAIIEKLRKGSHEANRKATRRRPRR